MNRPEVKVIETEKEYGWKFQYKGQDFGRVLKKPIKKEEVKEIGERNLDQVIKLYEKI